MITAMSPAEPASLHPGTRPSLLVVDDELGPRDSLRMVFQRDFAVHSFDNGFDAIEFARKNVVHVVILDLCMAGIDGIETLRRLKEVDPGIEAIMLTAYSDMNSTVAALRLSACDYQKKPFNVPELEGAVKRALQRRLRTESLRGAEQRLQNLFQNINAMAEREAKLLCTTTTLEGVLHDINNPLTVVLGYAQLLSTRIDSAKTGESFDIPAMEAEIEVIRRHIEICTNITERYHTLQRSAGDNSWSDVRQTLSDFQMFASAHPAIRKSQLTVIPFSGKVQVPISATELVQILINLTANAFQHGGVRNQVTVEVQIHNAPIDRRGLPASPDTVLRCQSKFLSKPPFVKISVTDEGAGITPDTLARIFEPHFTTKADKTGTGLGLAIVENIVAAAKGLIQVTSRPGEGTQFTITLAARVFG
jgi:two-component system, sensor histidine kinase and response regulator